MRIIFFKFLISSFKEKTTYFVSRNSVSIFISWQKSQKFAEKPSKLAQSKFEWISVICYFIFYIFE